MAGIFFINLFSACFEFFWPKFVPSGMFTIVMPNFGVTIITKRNGINSIIGTAWVQVTNATLNFGIICQKKGVAYDPLLSVKY